jgi:decaprenylphospho-beta-D-erythro-pentofuranosid-2-ulose 2-reductase
VKRILIIGASSAIAEHAARLWAARGDALFLVARDAGRLEAIAADLEVRGAARCGRFVMEATDLAAHGEMMTRAEECLGGLDVVLIAYGTLSDQATCQEAAPLALRELTVNALSVVALLTPLANRFERQRQGVIAVISSVAGDRGRASNYVYGSAKALLTAFLSGLRQRLHAAGVAVVTLKPGFVDTPMTAGFSKGLLWAQPRAIGAGIVRAIDRRAPVSYLPWFWRPIMLLVRLIPERIFRGLRL